MEKVITESLHEYNGYTIKIRCSTFNGILVKIFKVQSEKWYNLRQEHWDFYKVDELLQKAKNYIDNFPDRLELKFKRITEMQNK